MLMVSQSHPLRSPQDGSGKVVVVNVFFTSLLCLICDISYLATKQSPYLKMKRNDHVEFVGRTKKMKMLKDIMNVEYLYISLLLFGET